MLKSRRYRRACKRAFLCLASGAIAGAISSALMTPIALPIGAVVGCCVAAITSPVVVFCSWRKRAGVVIAILITVPVAATLPSSFMDSPGVSIALGAAAFVLVSPAILAFVPAEPPHPDCCAMCGYLLGQLERCPECGHVRTSPAASHASIVMSVFAAGCCASLLLLTLVASMPLVKWVTARSDEQLIQLLGDSDLTLRIRARRALVHRGLPPLLRAIGSHDPAIRANAAIGLGNFGDPGAKRALEHALHDSDPFVRFCAEDALTRLPH